MKLRNKILACAAPAAAITAIMPIALTSCNKNTPTWQLNFNEETKWNPSGIPLTGQYTDNEMTTKYYDFIKSNSVYLAEELFMNFRSASNTEGISGTAKAWIKNIDSVNHKVSFRFEMNISFTSEGETQTGKIIFDMENMKFVAKYDPDDGFGLNIGWTKEEFLIATDWKFYSLYSISGEEDKPLQADASSTTAEKEKVWEELDSPLDSYYMSKCTYKAS